MTTQQILKDAELQNPHRLTNDHIHAITRHFGRLAEPEDLTTRNKGAGTDIVQHMSGMTELAQQAARVVRYVIDGTDEEVLLTLGGMKEAAERLRLSGIRATTTNPHGYYGETQAALKERARLLRPGSEVPPGLWVRMGQVFAAARHAAGQPVQAPPGWPDWLAALVVEINQAWHGRSQGGRPAFLGPERSGGNAGRRRAADRPDRPHLPERGAGARAANRPLPRLHSNGAVHRLGPLPVPAPAGAPRRPRRDFRRTPSVRPEDAGVDEIRLHAGCGFAGAVWRRPRQDGAREISAAAGRLLQRGPTSHRPCAGRGRRRRAAGGSAAAVAAVRPRRRGAAPGAGGPRNLRPSASDDREAAGGAGRGVGGVGPRVDRVAAAAPGGVGNHRLAGGSEAGTPRSLRSCLGPGAQTVRAADGTMELPGSSEVAAEARTAR